MNFKIMVSRTDNPTSTSFDYFSFNGYPGTGKLANIGKSGYCDTCEGVVLESFHNGVFTRCKKHFLCSRIIAGWNSNIGDSVEDVYKKMADIVEYIEIQEIQEDAKGKFGYPKDPWICDVCQYLVHLSEICYNCFDVKKCFEYKKTQMDFKPAK